MKNYLPGMYSPVERMFDEMFDDFFRPARRMVVSKTMKTDVVEKDGFYNMSIELPGYAKEDIKVDLVNGYLNISAEHKNEKEEKDNNGNVIRSERSFGSCSRSFYIGNALKQEDIKAKYENGVLNIVLPSEEKKALESKVAIDIE